MDQFRPTYGQTNGAHTICEPPETLARRGCVLVTGAGGFLGANVVRSLRQHGLRVRALVRRPPHGPRWHGLSDVDFVYGDVRDRRSVDLATDGVDYVIHTAAVTEHVPNPRELAFDVNVQGTRNVCAAALKLRVRRLVYTSSASTLLSNGHTQSLPLGSAIHSAYTTSKRNAERVVQDIANEGLETVTLRPGFIIGPCDARPTTNQLLLYVARKASPWLPPGGMNFIDVREAALAHVRALWMGEPNERYVLAGPYATYGQLGVLVKQVLATQANVRVLPRWAYFPGSIALALLTSVFTPLRARLSLPHFQYGFIPFEMSGARADAVFGLNHRPLIDSVADTLQWFAAGER